MNEKTYTYALNIQTTGEKEAKDGINSVANSLEEVDKQAKKTKKTLKGFWEKLKKESEDQKDKEKTISERFDLYNKAYKAMMDNFTGTMDVYKSALKNQIDDMKIVYILSTNNKLFVVFTHKNRNKSIHLPLSGKAGIA